MKTILASILFLMLSQSLSAKPFGIGFRSFALEDVWHSNRILTNFRPQPIHRRIWVSLWYPSSTPDGSMKHVDYFEAIEPFDKAYLSAFQRFRNAIMYQEVNQLSQVMPFPQNPWPSPPPSFERTTGATRDAPFADGIFPVVIYHTGSQGRFEENAPLFESLARLGYCVLTVIGPDLNGNIDYTRRTPEQKLADTIIATETLRRYPQINISQIILMGYSAGAQDSLRAALKGFESKALILLDTTLEEISRMRIEYSLLDELENAPGAFTTPILAFAATNHQGKKNRFEIYKNTTHAPKIFIDLGSGMEHNDFMWHGIVEREIRQPFDQKGLELARQRHSFIEKTVIAYLEQALRPFPDWNMLRPVIDSAGSLISYSTLPEAVTTPKPDLDLIFGLRFMGEGAQALDLCKSVPPQDLPDPLLCVVTALENQSIELAETFMKAFQKSNSKTPKHFFARIRMSEAKELEKIIKSRRAKKP